MNALPTALILDDDPVLLKLLSLRLEKRFQNLIVECQQQPVAVGAYDIYILDNDFHGRPLAADLAEHIKQQQPDSLVLALSGTLDTVTLKRLINCGCSGAFDKSVPAEIDALLACVAQHLNEVNAAGFVRGRPRARIADTARAIAGLIRDWNRRLELEELREERGAYPDGAVTDPTSNGMHAAKTVECNRKNMRI